MIALSHLVLFFAEGGGLFSAKYQPLWQVVNFVVFVALMVYLLRNKIGVGKIFDDRAATIRRELDKARVEKEEAERKLAEVEARLGRLDQEVAQIKAEAEREAEREGARIRESAAADAEKIRQMTRREIEGAMKEARTELRAFVADHAVSMAETIIRREIRPEDSSRMLTHYVDELGEVAK